MGNQSVGKSSGTDSVKLDGYAKGREARDRLINTAVQLFSLRGYKGCSISDLEAASGITKNQLFHHFGSKDKLAAAAIDYAKSAWREQVVWPVNGFKDPAARLVHILAKHQQLSREGWMPLKLIVSMAATLEALPPAVRTAVEGVINEIFEYFRTLIKELKTTGQMQRPGKARHLATFTVQLLFGQEIITQPGSSAPTGASHELLAQLLLD